MSLTWSEYLKEDAIEIHSVELPLNKSNVAELVLDGDNHLGNPVYDMTKIPMKVLKSQIDYIEKNEEMMVMGLGDDLEAISRRPASHIRNSGRETLIREEAELFCNVWNPILNRFIGRVQGNHELRITREVEKLGLSGIPIVDEEILKESPNCILPEPERGVILKLKVGEQNYYGYCSHGTGVSIKPDYYLMKVFGVFEGLDFCAMGHIHQTFSQNYPILIPTRSKNPERKSRWGIRSGTTTPYLAYAEKKLYPVTEPTNMIMSFESDRKKIKVERLMQDRILC